MHIVKNVWTLIRCQYVAIVNVGVVELSLRRCTDLTMKGNQPNSGGEMKTPF